MRAFEKRQKNLPSHAIERVYFDPLVKKSDLWTQNLKYLVRLTFLWNQKLTKVVDPINIYPIK